MGKDDKTIEELAMMAEQNDADAMYQLGMHYLKGIDMEEDCDTAYELIIKAAELHHPEAECTYGCALFSTHLDDRSKKRLANEAFYWFGLAHKHGSKDAADRMQDVLNMTQNMEQSDKTQKDSLGKE